MATWRVFMSPSRDISNSQDIRQSQIQNDYDRLIRQKHNVTAENNNVPMSTSNQNNSIRQIQWKPILEPQNKQTIPTGRSTHKKHNSLMQHSTVKLKQPLWTTEMKAPYRLLKQQRQSSNQKTIPLARLAQMSEVVKDLSQSFEGDKAFIKSRSPEEQQEDCILDQINIIESDERDTLNNECTELEHEKMKNDLSSIKHIMLENNQMIHVLTSKLEDFQRDQKSITMLKMMLKSEQQTNRSVAQQMNRMQSQLNRIQNIVVQQQRTMNNKFEIQNHFTKRRSKSSITQPKFIPLYDEMQYMNAPKFTNKYYVQQEPKKRSKPKEKVKSHSQLLQKRKVVDLLTLKQTIRQALQEVYFEYLDEE